MAEAGRLPDEGGGKSVKMGRQEEREVVGRSGSRFDDTFQNTEQMSANPHRQMPVPPYA